MVAFFIVNYFDECMLSIGQKNIPRKTGDKMYTEKRSVELMLSLRISS